MENHPGEGREPYLITSCSAAAVAGAGEEEAALTAMAVLATPACPPEGLSIAGHFN